MFCATKYFLTFFLGKLKSMPPTSSPTQHNNMKIRKYRHSYQSLYFSLNEKFRILKFCTTKFVISCLFSNIRSYRSFSNFLVRIKLQCQSLKCTPPTFLPLFKQHRDSNEWFVKESKFSLRFANTSHTS